MTKGQRIRELREQKKMTQEELAKALNTTKQTISKYEKDIITNIPSDRIEELSVVLGSTPEYILGWEKVQKNNDVMADIIVKMRTDEDFFEAVNIMYSLNEEKFASVKQMLTLLK
jgi:transcriptional regulator with XRE-family HTH domain